MTAPQNIPERNSREQFKMALLSLNCTKIETISMNFQRWSNTIFQQYYFLHFGTFRNYVNSGEKYSSETMQWLFWNVLKILCISKRFLLCISLPLAFSPHSISLIFGYVSHETAKCKCCFTFFFYFRSICIRREVGAMNHPPYNTIHYNTPITVGKSTCVFSHLA